MRIKSVLRKVARRPVTLRARRILEVAVTPNVRWELAQLRAQSGLSPLRSGTVGASDLSEDVQREIAELSRALPSLLAAITSSNGIARQTRRDLDQLRLEVEELRGRRTATEPFDGVEELRARVAAVEHRPVQELHGVDDLVGLWRADLAPHVTSIEWLLRRVEMIRAEALNEIRYGPRPDGESSISIEPRLVTLGALDVPDLKLNLGCGHIALEGYVNVDMRDIPGVDLIAAVDQLPVTEATVAEIFSAHVLEHFPRQELVRHLLPYWHGLLRPGGIFRAVVPDLPAMAEAYAAGTMSHDSFRDVVYGGLEYEGDAHHTGFSGEDLVAVLQAAGFEDVRVVASARPNGECLELEVAAAKV